LIFHNILISSKEEKERIKGKVILMKMRKRYKSLLIKQLILR